MIALQAKPHYATAQSGEWFDTETWMNGEIPLYPTHNIWIRHDVSNPPPLEPWTSGTIISNSAYPIHIMRLPKNADHIIAEARFRERHGLN